MYRRILGSLLTALCLLAAQAGAAVVDDARARQLISQHVDEDAPGSGIAVAIVSPDGVRTYFHGTSGRPERATIDEHTLFETGSLTKTFTAALLLDMVDRGELRLDTPLRSLLPPDVRLGRELPRPIVLQDLATHRSGLPGMPNGKAYRKSLLSDLDNPVAAYRPEHLWAWFNERNIKGVGQRFEYSNLGFGTLGLALARRLDMSYPEALRTRILQPLGLKDTYIGVPAEAQSRQAQPHNRKGKPVPAVDMPAFEGAGAIRSTLSDMILWLDANMKHRAPITLQLHAPLAEADNKNLQVALSWVVSNKEGRTIVWHNGSTNGSSSFMGFIPATSEGVIVLANSVVLPDELAVRLLGVIP